MDESKRKSRKLRKTLIIVSVIIALLVVIRAAMPEYIKGRINWFLANKMESYTGHIDDFDLSLWRGAYQIQGLVIEKKNSKARHPMVSLREADLSVSWRALFQGKFLADLIFYDPVVVFADSADAQKKQTATEDKNWDEIFNGLIPFKLESVQVVNGQIMFENNDSLKAPILLKLSSIEIMIRNIRNTSRDADELYANLTMTSTVQDSAKFWVRGRFNLAKSFDLDSQLSQVDLKLLNSFFQAYGPFDVQQGSLSLDAELENKGQTLKGYVKPILKDLNVIENHERYKTVRETQMEIVTGLSGYFLRNSKSRSVGTIVKIGGSLKDPNIDYWGALWIAIKNSFGEPDVKPGLENKKQIKN